MGVNVRMLKVGIASVVSLSLALLPSPAMAGDLKESIAREGRRAAAEAQANASQDKNELLVPGLAVLGVGTVVFLYGLVHDTGVQCTTNVSQLSANCGTTKSKAVIFTGAAIAGAGGFMIWKGNRDNKARPELVPMVGGALVRQRLTW